MSIVTGKKEYVGDWVSKLIGNTNPWHDYEAIGIERNGELIAGAVIDNYIPGARCSVHCAGTGKKWLTREFLFVVFDYVFRQLKCSAVMNIVDGTNVDSLRFTAHLGFSEVYRIKGGGKNGSDGVIFEMQKSSCRWINLKEKS